MNDNIQSTENDFVAISFVFDGQDNVIPHLIVSDHEEKAERTPLTAEEKKLLAECEKEIEDNLGPASTVGYRLRIIKTQLLYREKYDSFEAYCKQQWGLSRFHVDRLVKAETCIENLKKAHQIGAPVAVPAKESHARPIADLSPEKQVEVAKKVHEKAGKGKVTAKHWEEARQEVEPRKPASKPAVTQEKKIEQPAISKSTDDSKAGSTTNNQPPNVVPLPAPVTSAPAGFVTPAQFHKGVKIPSLQELSALATLVDNIRSNSSRKPDFEKGLFDLKQWLALYAKWETAMKPILGLIQNQEAA